MCLGKGLARLISQLKIFRHDHPIDLMHPLRYQVGSKTTTLPVLEALFMPPLISRFT
jgi:hypothetical protein